MTDDRDDTVGEDPVLQPDPFLAALKNALDPTVLLRAGDDLGELIQAVKDVRRKGTLTLTISIVPDKNHGSDVVFVQADTSVKAPRPTPKARLLWPLDGGRLSTRDPRQLEIHGLSAIEGGAGHDRSTDAQEGTAS